MENKRAIVYIDGFNLYNGIMDKGLKKYRWLNLFSLSQKIIPGGYELHLVRYFTSRIKGNQEKYLRQMKYIAALKAYLGGKIDEKYGNFQVFLTHCKY